MAAPSASIPVVTRFAPSPTGHLHIGGARTALFCWAYAKRTGGHFLVRVEDTDQARSSEASARGILEDLAWLGILWDEGPRLEAEGRVIGGDPRGVAPFFQAQRIDIYNRYVEGLVRAGRAYPAFETAAELDAKRKDAVAKKQTYRYDRAALAIPMVERLRRMGLDGGGTPEAHVVRLRVPDDPIHVVDEVLGEVSYAAGELDDFVVRKADGFPTYHFAVVIDDELMGVTHVLRGQEHLNNTPRHVALQKALGFRTPVYAHMPLIANMDGGKMSKRDKAKTSRAFVKAVMKSVGEKNAAMMIAEASKSFGVPKEAIEASLRRAPSTEALAAAAGIDAALLSGFVAADNDDTEVAKRIADFYGLPLPEIEVEDFRRAGYLPGVINNFITLLGWSPGGDREKFDMAFLAENFSLDRIGKTSAKFDRVKLLSFNGDAIAAMSDADFAAAWREWMRHYTPTELAKLESRGAGSLERIAAAVKLRSKTLRDGLRAAAFALVSDDEYSFDEAAVNKALKKGTPTGLDLLAQVRAELERLSSFDAKGVDEAVNAFAQRAGVGAGQIAQPLRVAVTGTTVSPGIGETLAALGRESTLQRIDRCLRTVTQ
jgi:glutamyl/glutaminyl-tRNA synthetase